MKIRKPNTHDIPNIDHRRWTENLFKIFQRNISFGSIVDGTDQNIDGKMVEIVDTGVAGTLNTVNHYLGRVPKFVDLKYKNVSGDWFDGGTSWTVNQIFVKFTIDHMHVRLFIH